MPSMCGVQGWAEPAQTSSAGSIQDASSSEPALMNATCGMAALTLNSGEPQAEQNLRSVSPPWSEPVVENDASVSPSTVSASRGTPITTENGLLVWRWQSVQWQTACASGSASAL